MQKTTLSRLLETKNIGYFAGVCFIFNTISGPAIPYTAANFQNTGWLFTGICYLLLTILAGFCNLFLIESIQQVPGNKYFQGDIEFSTLINFFFGPRMHYLSQLVLYAALQSNGIQCLVLTAQATDQFLIDIAGHTCGLSFNKNWICISLSADGDYPSPFGNETMVFTLGILVALLIAIPFFFYDLDKSVVVTVGAAVMSMAIALVWISVSIQQGLMIERMPATRPFGIHYASTVGVIMLNLGCATVIPSWINIKSNRVRTQSVMWSTMGLSAIFYVVIGIFFSLGFNMNSSDNSLLALMSASGSPTLICKISVALYAYVMLLPSVPVNCIISDKNLTQNNIMNKYLATFFAFVLPVFVCIPLQTGNYLFVFLTWTSLTFTAIVNFILPLILYLKCVEFRFAFKSKVLTLHQLKLLSVIHSKSIEIERYLRQKQDQSPPVLERVDTAKSQYTTPQIVLIAPTLQEVDPSASQEELHMAEANEEIILAPHILALQKFEKKIANLDEYSRISLRASSSLDYPILADNTFVHPMPDISSGETQRSTPSNTQYTLDPSIPRAPNLDEAVTFLDPYDMAIPDEWLEDFDPESSAMFDDSIGPAYPDTAVVNHHTTDPGNAQELAVNTRDLLSPPGLSSSGSSLRRSSVISSSAISSGSGESLPREKKFKCPPFRAVPKWVPLSPSLICKIMLCSTVFISIANLSINIYFSV